MHTALEVAILTPGPAKERSVGTVGRREDLRTDAPQEVLRSPFQRLPDPCFGLLDRETLSQKGPHARNQADRPLDRPGD